MGQEHPKTENTNFLMLNVGPYTVFRVNTTTVSSLKLIF